MGTIPIQKLAIATSLLLSLLISGNSPIDNSTTLYLGSLLLSLLLSGKGPLAFSIDMPEVAGPCPGLARVVSGKHYVQARKEHW